ncbi:MAG: D-alanyl-D-alanine carboxypeptidase/D-alanyl-D-alanine-endopeptidase [Gemmatimonadaceae bacterium]|nr:D-alanyl-D-alanine carboxypeptidase/D-alanyl-D-alanine-endopeptidase [Gemmatimonadaceae bacterium]
MRHTFAAFTVVCVATACASRPTPPPTRPAPVETHRPEPVAPVMMPVAEVRTPPPAKSRVAYVADSAVSAPMWRNARWGMLIVDAANGDTIYSHDADRLFMPASNQKLLTGAIALSTLGPDYQWRTPIILRGIQRGKVFHGDLVIVGRGDPSVSDSLRGGNALAAFDPIAEALRARGIASISGRVTTSEDYFEGITSGLGWEIDDLDTPSGAVVDELLFNEGYLRLTVRAGERAGRPVTGTLAPRLPYPQVRFEATTRAAGIPGERLEVAYDSIGNAVVVRGTLAVGDSQRVTRSYRHPNDAYRAALIARLAASGIRVKGPFVAPRMTAAATRAQMAMRRDTLVVLQSLPLRELLPRLQKPSQNQLAEMFFRTSGRVGTAHGSADSARAFAARALAQLGVAAEQAAYRDGSGLSRHDYVTPSALITVLSAMHRSPWAKLYRESLPLAGVDGTIANRMRNTPAAGNANAKTGTLDKTRALSGYVTSADGRTIIFSLIANNYTVPTREVDRVQDLLVSTLASLSFASPATDRVP